MLPHTYNLGQTRASGERQDVFSGAAKAGNKTVAGVGRIVKCQFQCQRVRRRNMSGRSHGARRRSEAACCERQRGSNVEAPGRRGR
ncbi:unnamed protein product, partial [Ectocarpus sp. 12 AP-2014]